MIHEPDHLKYFEGLVAEPEDNTEHPLDQFCKVEQKFATPIMEGITEIPQKMREDLIKVLQLKEQKADDIREKDPDFYSIATSKGFYATTHYNLFDSVDEFPFAKESILGFESIACQLIRYYIRKGWGVQQADEVKLEGRCFGNIQDTGARTYPHYHQDQNGVLVHYLALGDENVALKDRVMKDMEKSPRHSSHQVIFLDPRPAISYPYWEKVHTVTPQVGMTIIHPSSLWHETNTWLGEGLRACIVVNFRIVSHGYNELARPLRG